MAKTYTHEVVLSDVGTRHSLHESELATNVRCTAANSEAERSGYKARYETHELTAPIVEKSTSEK